MSATPARMYYNSTVESATIETVTIGNMSEGPHCTKRDLDSITIVFIVLYSIIFMAGLFGNLLVIVVVLKYDRLKTVTNFYILNLSIADSLFLIVLPALVTMAIMNTWIFGHILCKVYFALDCINKFTSAFTVTVMAGDRYMAACHPITSLQYRTPKYALTLIAAIWACSFIVMSPAIVFAGETTCHKCRISWPQNGYSNETIFTAYTFVLAFAIPTIFICVFYTLIIVKLAKGGHASISHKRHCQFRKATRLVTIVICVFIMCWLPYWIVQVIILVSPIPSMNIFRTYQAFTLLSYINSMLNPLLYGFTNDYFRNAFNNAFHCVPATAQPARNAAVRGEDAGKICHHLEAAFDNNRQPGIEMAQIRESDKFIEHDTKHSNFQIEA